MSDTADSSALSRAVAAYFPVVLAAALFVWLFGFVEVISAGDVIRESWAWVPSLGVRLSFLIDGLSLIFGLLITGIGALVLLYSGSYLRNHPQYGRFALFLSLFMLSMLGLVLADNLITLFVFWELTTVTSYLLIGFDHANPRARRNALQAMLVTGAGALALLAGFILLGAAAGSFELSVILAKGDEIRAHAMYLPILILVLLGAFTKSAQVPFHFWLPNAMAAPTPVSAYLHSATMVKAGVYLLARMHPALSGTDIWLWTLTLFGATTAVFASVMALRQTDMKTALAYTTLMALGSLTLFLGANVTIAITAAVTFLIVHSLYKAALFLVVGIVDKQTGTRDIALIGGLARAMPITALAAAVSALSMAGFPPLVGFIGKELKYKGALAIASEPVLVAVAVLLANALMFAVACVLVLKPFFGARGETPRKPVEAPFRLWIGPILLAGLGAVFGVAPNLMGQALVEPAVSAILAQDAEVKLKIWHGINIPLALSVVTFALGIALYVFSAGLRQKLNALALRLPNFDTGWDRFLDGLKALAAWQTRLLQSGVLRHYLFATFATATVGIGATLLLRADLSVSLDLTEPSAKHWTVAVLIMVGAVLTAWTNSRIVSIAGLGVVGIGVALLFIIFGAPDVAITQLLVETLVVVLIAVAMLRLPLLDIAGEPRRRPLDMALAVAFGAAAGTVLLLVTAGPLDLRLTEYFETASWPDAYGRNIVNVILVDFRALDTFGEIAVVVVAAIGAYALVRSASRRGEESGS